MILVLIVGFFLSTLKAAEVPPEVKSILQNRCVNCHDSYGSPKLSFENFDVNKLIQKGFLGQDFASKKSLHKRISDKSMPQSGSDEAKAMTEGERKILIDYVISLKPKNNAISAISQFGVRRINCQRYERFC